MTDVNRRPMKEFTFDVTRLPVGVSNDARETGGLDRYNLDLGLRIGAVKERRDRKPERLKSLSARITNGGTESDNY